MNQQFSETTLARLVLEANKKATECGLEFDANDGRYYICHIDGYTCLTDCISIEQVLAFIDGYKAGKNGH